MPLQNAPLPADAPAPMDPLAPAPPPAHAPGPAEAEAAELLAAQLRRSLGHAPQLDQALGRVLSLLA